MDERDFSRDTELGLLLGYFFFLESNRLRAVATTVLKDIDSISAEYWVAMEFDVSFCVIPLYVQQIVSLVEERSDFPCVVSFPIRNKLHFELVMLVRYGISE